MRCWAVFVFALPACGIDESGLLPQPSNDASTVDGPNDVAEAATDSPPPPPGPCSTPPGACMASVPQGWNLIAFDPQGATTCPSSYTAQATVSNPIAQSGACDCSCSITSSPACDVGQIQRYISNDTSCGTAGVSLNVNGPGCTAWPSSGTLSPYSKGAALGPNGGSCSGTPVPNKSAVTTSNGNACAPPTNCQEDVCNGKGPAGFAVCVEGPSNQTCPAGWGSSPIAVGDGFDLACSACNCDLNGTTCTNASLTIYGDSQCNTSLVSLAVDGQCSSDSAAGKLPLAFTYKATLNAVCNATGPKTATPTLTNQKTICCKPN